jgi:hypothetical protein
MKIQETYWVAKSFDVTNDFTDEIAKNIKKFQGLGYEVEIQYQQSDNVVSAFIIGRGE